MLNSDTNSMIKYGASVTIMMMALVRMEGSTVTPVFRTSRGSVSCLSTAFPRTMSQRPARSPPVHATVSSITVLPASAPIPTCTCSIISSALPRATETKMIVTSGRLPRRGITSPPITPGLTTSISSSLPSAIVLAALEMMYP